MPSHGKPKLANWYWQTSKSWQTHSFTRQSLVKSLHMVICNMKGLSETQFFAQLLLCFVCLVLYLCRLHAAGQLWMSSINLKVASCSSWLASAILWSVTQINHMNRARVLIDWQLTTHVCKSFTCQKRVHQPEKVGEIVGENTRKYYFSPTV